MCIRDSVCQGLISDGVVLPQEAHRNAEGRKGCGKALGRMDGVHGCLLYTSGTQRAVQTKLSVIIGVLASVQILDVERGKG